MLKNLKKRRKRVSDTMDVSQTIFDEYTDEIGPEKIIHIHEPVLKLKSIVVIDNVAAGPAIRCPDGSGSYHNRDKETCKDDDV